MLHVNGRIKDKTGYVVPVGTIVAYAASSAPEGWLLCDGKSVSTSKYSDLYEVIGTTYGGSNSNFNLPNLQGRVPVGYDETVHYYEYEKDANSKKVITIYPFKDLGKAEGEVRHELSEGEMPKHAHGIKDDGHIHQIGLSLVYKEIKDADDLIVSELPRSGCVPTQRGYT
ncbi:MAG: tail fiber protein, partial [Okeania sp. SIO2D1]|nr:tail fiber protein [Okeania sp. SIO2D1]